MNEVGLRGRASFPMIDDGQLLMQALLERVGDFPTAVFAHNDNIAVGALSKLRDAGLRVPDDVSLAGYNDLPMVDQLSPPLTTVRYPSLEVGTGSGRDGAPTARRGVPGGHLCGTETHRQGVDQSPLTAVISSEAGTHRQGSTRSLNS